MKYNADAYSPYPVLRPHSRDFPNGLLRTRLRQLRKDDFLDITLEFDIHEPAIAKHIEKGDAVCCAMVYCTSTCYSEMIKAANGDSIASGSVPLKLLNGRVEVHPSIIAEDDLVLRTDTTHQEYGSDPIPVSRGRRLAMDEPYHFAVGYVAPIESIFRLDASEGSDLNDWEFNHVADTQTRYITIMANPETYNAFQVLRSQVPLTAATVYLNALTTAIGELQREQEDNEYPQGWASSVRTHIERQQIDWRNMYSGLVAQKLLRTPLSYLKEAM